MLNVSWALLSLLLMAAPANALPGNGGNNDNQPSKQAAQAQTPSQPCVCGVQIHGDGSPQKQATRKDSEQWDDWVKAFGPASWSNWALFAAAFWAGWMAIRTLRAIERQTSATEDAAKVAKANMDALISKERARIRVEPPRNDLSFLVPGHSRRVKSEFAPYVEEQAIEISVFNRGETTARDVSASFSISIEPTSIEVERRIRDTVKVSIGDLAANSEPFKYKFALHGGIQQEDLEAIHDQRYVLRVFGEITYADAFNPPKGLTTAFSFEWKSDAEWYASRSVRAESDNSSGWNRVPANANYTT